MIPENKRSLFFRVGLSLEKGEYTKKKVKNFIWSRKESKEKNKNFYMSKPFKPRQYFSYSLLGLTRGSKKRGEGRE